MDVSDYNFWGRGNYKFWFVLGALISVGLNMQLHEDDVIVITNYLIDDNLSIDNDRPQIHMEPEKYKQVDDHDCPPEPPEKKDYSLGTDDMEWKCPHYYDRLYWENLTVSNHEYVYWYDGTVFTRDYTIRVDSKDVNVTSTITYYPHWYGLEVVTNITKTYGYTNWGTDYLFVDTFFFEDGNFYYIHALEDGKVTLSIIREFE